MSPSESQRLFALLLGLFIPLCCFHQANALLNSTAQLGSQWTVQAPGSNLSIIANDNFSLVLSFMESSHCVLSVQHIPSGLHVWIASFNNAAMNASQNCSLALQQDGDLQLKDDGKASWSSGTGSRGVRELQLLGSGNLVLVNSTFTNVTQDIVWQSFEHPSDTLITGQKLPYGVTMFAASDTNPYHAGNVYSMELSNHFSDLMLYANLGRGSGPQQYWSMAETFTLPANAWVCCWASYLELSNGLTIFDNQSAAGLSTSSSSTNSQFFEYVRLESDGNLRTYTFRGGAWQLNFQALTRLCQYPDACGPYGVCSSTSVDVCSSTCLPGFHLLNSSNPSQGCTSSSLPSVYECPSNASDNVMLNATGYTYFSAQGFYMSAEVAPDSFTSIVDECGTLCLQNCSCQAAFFSVEGCYLMNHPIETLQHNNDNKYTAFIKLTNDSNLLASAPAPLQPQGNSPSLPPALSGTQLPTSNGVNRVRVLASVFSGSAAIAVIILGLALWYARIRRKAQQNADDEMFLDTLPGLPPRYTYRDLHEATEGFSKKLGAGGFGAVYEGVLPHDNSRIAVKQLKDAHHAGIKQFRAEVATLGKISHINLVKLCGYCVEGFHRILVYEFMDKQSLDRALFHVEADVPLDLKTRYAISLGTAKGLAYLHEECTNRIIHCDIKPENILLDQHWVPKVADFGLAKPMDRDQSHVVTTLRGTRGYLAPEWLKNASITEKADVFSYGIVLLELVAGRRSFELGARAERCYLPAWAFDVLERGEDLMVLADERLHTEIMGKQEEEQKIIRMVKVALWCVQEDPSLRPAMSLVVKFLEGEAEVGLPPVTHFFAKARPHEDDLESGGDTCGPAQLQEDSSMSHLQSELSWQISTLVSGR